MQGFTDRSPEVLRRLRRAVTAALNDIGQIIANNASNRVVRDTGELARSIRYVVDEENFTVTIGSDSEYASYVELGTGPHYNPPAQWVYNAAQRGYHTQDPWWYFDEREGEFKLGWFVTSRPYLQPAVTDNIGQLEGILRNHMRNA